MVKNLFVAGLSYDTTNDSLKNHFAEIGNVVSAQVIIDKYTNRSKGFGFVEMSTEEEARLAMDKLNNSSLDNRNIVVKEAKPREENRGGGGGYGGGGGGGHKSGGNNYNRNRNGHQGGYQKRDNRDRY